MLKTEYVVIITKDILGHGQTQAKRMNPRPSFQHWMYVFLCMTHNYTHNKNSLT
jgi:hypothetical protein